MTAEGMITTRFGRDQNYILQLGSQHRPFQGARKYWDGIGKDIGKSLRCEMLLRIGSFIVVRYRHISWFHLIGRHSNGCKLTYQPDLFILICKYSFILSLTDKLYGYPLQGSSIRLRLISDPASFISMSKLQHQ